MPIRIVCPGCDVELNVPDTSAGKKVRCPRPECGTVASVPGQCAVKLKPVVAPRSASIPAAVPVPVTATTPVPIPPPRPAPVALKVVAKPVVVAAPVIEEVGKKPHVDEEDLPVQRKKRRKNEDEDDEEDEVKPGNKKTLIVAIAGLAFVALCLIGGIGNGVYALVSPSGTGGIGKNVARPPLPAGWQDFSFPSDNFKAYFPIRPRVERPQNAPDGRNDADHDTIYTVTMPGPTGLIISVTVTRFRSSLSPAAREQFLNTFTDQPGTTGTGDQKVETRAVIWLGENARETATPQRLERLVVTERAAYTATIARKDGRRAALEEENAFFESFALLK